MKKTIIITAICGIAIVVGVVLYFSNEKKKKFDVKECETATKKPEEEISFTDLNEQKSSFASTISERHSVAAQIIRDTLNEENNQVGESVHKVDFDEIDSGLDSLIDEE